MGDMKVTGGSPDYNVGGTGQTSGPKKNYARGGYREKRIAQLKKEGRLNDGAEKITQKKAELEQVSKQPQKEPKAIKDRSFKDVREINIKVKDLLFETNMKENMLLGKDGLDKHVLVLSDAVDQMKQITKKLKETKANNKEINLAHANLKNLESKLKIFSDKRSELELREKAFKSEEKAKLESKPNKKNEISQLDQELNEFIEVLQEAAKEPGKREIFENLINEIHIAKRKIDKEHPANSSTREREITKLMENAAKWTEAALG